jgi:hypothetical protein
LQVSRLIAVLCLPANSTCTKAGKQSSSKPITLPNCEPRGTILQWEDWHAHLAGESQGNDFLHEQAGMDTNSDLMFGNLGADTF